MTTPSIDQLLIEATEAMNRLTEAVVYRSDFTQMTAAMQAAEDGKKTLAEMKKLLTETPAALISTGQGNILKLGPDGKLLVTSEWAQAPNW